MLYTLIIFKTALDDLHEALDWYDSQSQGLEQRFSKEIDQRLAFITKHPEASPYLVENFRGIQLKKFPYTIYYEFDEVVGKIYVTAVLHNKQNRDNILSRL